MKFRLDPELIVKELHLRTGLEGFVPPKFSKSEELLASLAVKVKALSKESLFLLWVEEVSQTIAEVPKWGWVCCPSYPARYKGPGERLCFCLISPQIAHQSRLS